ncbi:MAG: hypothetical protein ACRC1K_08765, partial [Planctomycetia bacterium]
IAFIAFKAMLPFTTLITHAIRASLEPTLGVIAAGAVAWNTVFFAIPGAIAFLVWEIKEYWNLFRSNRAPRLETASVGAHGESILQLLHPGFHSGIVPSLCAKLRSAELAAYETGVWRAARTHRHHLEEIADDVQRFVDREFLGLLRESPAWKGRTIVVKEVRLACNCLRIDFADAAHPESIVCFSLEDRAGWLLADLLDAGWLDRIPADARAVFDRAAVGFFVLAGVDFVRTDLEAALPASTVRYEIRSATLAAWTKDDEPPLIYPLRTDVERSAAIDADGDPRPDAPFLDAQRMFLEHRKPRWEQWSQGWSEACDRTEQTGGDAPAGATAAEGVEAGAVVRTMAAAAGEPARPMI